MGTHKTQAECRINYVVSQYHTPFTDIYAADLVITPATGRRIIVQSFCVFQDASCVLSFASPGVDTIIFRPTGGTSVQVQSFPFFGGLDDQPLTVHRVSGGSASIGIELFWLEV